MKFKSDNINEIWYILQKAKAFKRKWDQRKLTEWDKWYGLCETLELLVLKMSVRHLINKRYKSYSGFCYFPVPHPDFKTPTVAYHSLTVDKYDRRTEYGRNRYEYLLTIISVLEDLIANHKE